jgi:uncharacterized protein YbjT (DUF2867 family)
MNVLIVGATGTLGRQIVRRALDEGHSVRCLVRNLSKASFLKEWGAELVKGDLCNSDTFPTALSNVDAIIDAATARPSDSQGIRAIDWDGKVNLIQAAKAKGVQRYIFVSILNAEHFRHVPLMDIKHCTELFLKEAGLDYTVLRCAGFFQGLIAQYAIPILERQSVWAMGEMEPVAYMDTQDIAKFAVKALSVPETVGGTYPVVGTKAWNPNEIIEFCEQQSGQIAKISPLPLNFLRTMRRVARFFQWGRNLSDRLAFTEVLVGGKPMSADMTEVYSVFGLDASETTTLESYLQEYFGRIMKKLKEAGFQKLKKPPTKDPSLFR